MVKWNADSANTLERNHGTEPLRIRKRAKETGMGGGDSRLAAKESYYINLRRNLAGRKDP